MPTNTPIDPRAPSPLGPGRELVVITRVDAQVRSGAERLTAAPATNVSALDTLQRESGATITPLFGVGQERLAAVAGTRHPDTNVELPDLSVFHRVHAPDEDLERLAARLLEHDAVEAAYVKPPAELPLAPEAPAPPAGPTPPMVTPPTSRHNRAISTTRPAASRRPFAWTRPGGGGAKSTSSTSSKPGALITRIWDRTRAASSAER